jgi:hypothetical protein
MHHIAVAVYSSDSGQSGAWRSSSLAQVQTRFTGSYQPRVCARTSPRTTPSDPAWAVLGTVSTGWPPPRGRFPARLVGHSTRPTANTRRQDRQRQRERHQSKHFVPFHQGRPDADRTASTAPQFGQARSKLITRANVRRGGAGAGFIRMVGHLAGLMPTTVTGAGRTPTSAAERSMRMAGAKSCRSRRAVYANRLGHTTSAVHRFAYGHPARIGRTCQAPPT